MNALATILTQNASNILTGIGLVSMTGATVLAVKGTPKAMLKIEKLKEELPDVVCNEEGNEIDPIKLTPAQILKEVWIDYLPAAACLAGGITCILIAKRIDAAKIAALASTAALLDEKLKLRDKAMEKLEPADREKVQEKIDQTILEEAGNPPWNSTELAPVTVEEGQEGRTMLCFESLSGQYFRSNPDKIHQAVAHFNSYLASSSMVAYGAHATVNDWLDLLDLETTNLFGALGWTAEHMFEVRLDTRLNEVDMPVLVVNYARQPKLLNDYDA